MHKGHLRPWSTAMAFSDEKSSLGRPQMFHCLILTASPRAVDRLKLRLQGTLAVSQAATQPAKQSDLCTDVKGPASTTRFHLTGQFGFYLEGMSWTTIKEDVLVGEQLQDESILKCSLLL